MSLRNAIVKSLKVETQIEEIEKKIYSESKSILKIQLSTMLLYQNSLLFSIILRFENIKGQTEENDSGILNLIGNYIMGFNFTKDTIFKGQYFKASNLLKQDLEILASISNIKNGDFKNGKTPNVKSLPTILKNAYGDLNGIGHPSNTNVLKNTLESKNLEGKSAISIFPFFNPGVFDTLLRYHLYIQHYMIIEIIMLYRKIYPQFSLSEDEMELMEAINMTNAIDNFLFDIELSSIIKTGVKSDLKEN